MELSPLSESSEELLRLIDGSNRLMTSLYPSESNHLEDIDSLFSANVFLCGAFVAGQLAGMGAVKKLRDDLGAYGEIKRVFVDPACRGKGIAIAVMDYLERHLAGLEIRISRLETGVQQPEAIALYRKLGYLERTPFGGYSEDPHSMFMEKRLDI